MDAKQYAGMIADAENRLKRLRVLYDQWFIGFERIEPAQQRDQFERLLKMIQREPTANTAMRFRAQQLQQRYTTYSTHWKRITRQIEEGTYRRDLVRAQRRKAAREEDETRPKHEALELDIDIDVDTDSALNDALASVMTPSAAPPAPAIAANGNGAAVVGGRDAAGAAGTTSTGSSRRFPKPPGAHPATSGSPPPAHSLKPPVSMPPPIPASASTRAPAASGAPPSSPRSRRAEAAGKVGSMSDQQIQRIYDRYVAARRQNAERTDNVRMEAIAERVRTMMPKLEKKHAGKQIDFEVVVRGGKVALKPVAK